MRKTLLFIFLILLLDILYLSAGEADAIPYFARKYNTQCMMCHTQFPVLNSTGMTFKQNGYMLEGETGDFVWENKLVPFSGKAAFEYRMLNRKGEGWSGEDGAQSIFLLREMRFYSAGTLAPQVSYFLDFGSENEEDFAPGAAFIIFDDIIPEGVANIKAGKFYNEFFYLSNKRRFTIEPYLSPVTRVQYGLEFNGEFQPRRIRYAIGVANDEMTREPAGMTETNYKSVSNYVRAFYGWATYNLRGQTIGIRGYMAKAGENLGVEEDHTQLDINVNLQFAPASLIIAYYTQTNVDGINDNEQYNLLSELILKAGPHLILDLRYEFQNEDIYEDKDSRYIINGSYYIAPNVGLTAEYVKQNGRESEKDEDKLQLGIQMAF